MLLAFGRQIEEMRDFFTASIIFWKSKILVKHLPARFNWSLWECIYNALFFFSVWSLARHSQSSPMMNFTSRVHRILPKFWCFFYSPKQILASNAIITVCKFQKFFCCQQILNTMILLFFRKTRSLTKYIPSIAIACFNYFQKIFRYFS